jgi:acetylornithine deacetylase/succinyl-diaminopimelate desuccinylase-like protein
MDMRRDAAAAAAEIVLLVERRCAEGGSLVGTVGRLEVPDGSVNVVPGRCLLSLDIRAADDFVRLSAVDDILAGISAICRRRGIDERIDKLLEAEAVPCAPRLMGQLGAAVERAGLPRFDLPSGAGHDAMAMAALIDVAMLFTRCGNGGISHNPLETMTADDADIAARVLLDFLRNFHPGEA